MLLRRFGIMIAGNISGFIITGMMMNFRGRFRLPKVYRYTYSNHIEGPLADVEVDKADIPELFRSVKKVDVSSEYFETADVTGGVDR